MDRLSSCYFCGDAVDAALEEYAIVPTDQYPDVETGQRIVLCPSCRQKLTTVIEHVLEAALNGEEPPPEEGMPLLDDDAPLADVGEDDSDLTATDVEPMENGDDGDTVFEAAASEASNGDRSTPEDESSAPESESNAPGQTAPATDDEQTTEADASSGAAGTSDDPSTSYATAEYNKVVRLLQNREFPVEIEEITVVARSAYNIDRNTTHEILEALIERGVVADEGDKLVRA